MGDAICCSISDHVKLRSEIMRHHASGLRVLRNPFEGRQIELLK